MSIITVSNSQELNAALDNAKGGETIVLQNTYDEANNQIDYQISMRGITSNGKDVQVVNPDSVVTITSADHNNPAIISDVLMANASNLVFDNLKFVSTREGNYDAQGYNVNDTFVHFTGANNITIQNSEFTGIADKVYYGNQGVEHGHLRAEDAIQISGDGFNLLNNEITGFYDGITLYGGTKNVRIEGNELHNIQNDYINGIGGLENITIDGNHLHSVLGVMGSYDEGYAAPMENHPDFIQIYDARGANDSITISNNIFDSNGGYASQSILLQGTNTNAVIENNLIHNAHQIGIRSGTDDTIIRNNTLLLDQNASEYKLAVDPQTGYTIPGEIIKTAGAAPSIEAQYAEKSVVENNIARIIKTHSDASVANNQTIDYTNPDAANYVSNLFTNALTGGEGSLKGIKIIPNGAADNATLGAHNLLSLVPSQFNAFFTSTQDAGDESVYHFDASLTATSSNMAESIQDTSSAATEDTTYTWIFGDGTTQTGRFVTHDFTTLGEQNVTLIAHQADGLTDSFTSKHIVSSSNVFHASTTEDNSGIINSSDSGIHINDILLRSTNYNSLSNKTSPISAENQGTRQLNASDLVDAGLSNHVIATTSQSPLQLATHDYLKFEDQLSVSFSFKLDTLEGGSLFKNSSAFEVNLNKDGSLFIKYVYEKGQAVSFKTDQAVSPNDWNQINISYDNIADKVAVFLNGEEVFTSPTLNDNLSLGGSRAHIGVFDGLINHLEVTRDSVNAQQALQAYQQLEQPAETVEEPHYLPQDAFTISFSYHTVEDTGGASWLLSARSGFGLVFNDNKATALLISDEGVKSISTTNTNLIQSGWHDVQITFSSDLGLFTLSLDGQVIAQRADLQGISMRGGVGELIEGHSSGKSYAGNIENLTIDNEAHFTAASTNNDIVIDNSDDFTFGGDGYNTAIVPNATSLADLSNQPIDSLDPTHLDENASGIAYMDNPNMPAIGGEWHDSHEHSYNAPLAEHNIADIL